MCLQGFPGGSDSKEYFCNAGDPGWFPPLGRSPGEGNGYPLQYSCLENTMIRGARWSMVHGIAKGQTWLSDQHFQLFYFYVFLMPQSYSESMRKKQYPITLLAFILSSKGFPHSSVGKESACHAGDSGLIQGSVRFPGEGNGNPLQYSCLENPMDRGAWRATVHGVSRVGHDLATAERERENVSL